MDLISRASMQLLTPLVMLTHLNAARWSADLAYGSRRNALDSLLVVTDGGSQ